MNLLEQTVLGRTCDAYIPENASFHIVRLAGTVN
jgi:hypothetical protein